MDPDNPLHLVVGLDSSHFYETFDGGNTWYNAGTLPLSYFFNPANLPYITSLAVADTNTFYAGTSDGSFWKGTRVNGNMTWTEADTGLKGVARGNVLDISVNPSSIDPVHTQDLFVVTNGFAGENVWATGNGGTSWVNVTGNLPPQYQVNTLAVDWAPFTSDVYVGTSRGVYVTRGIPSTPPSPPPNVQWSPFQLGLPQAFVTDLEIAPTLNILAAATYGRGAWEILLGGGSAGGFTPHMIPIGHIVVGEVTLAGNGTALSPVVATFTDPAGAGPLSEYRAELQWGTQATTPAIITPAVITYTPSTGTFSVHVAETAPEGSYRLVITVSKNGVAAPSVTAKVLVQDAPLSAAGASLTAVAHQPLTGLLATVNDAGGAEAGSKYSVAVNWGDSTAVDHSAQVVNKDGILQVQGTHTYLAPGHYRVQITISDHGGSRVTVDSPVTVTASAPPPPPGFADKAGGTGVNAGLAVATDAQGNIYIAGQFDGPADFPVAGAVVTLPGIGNADAFVAKYSPTGQFLWAQQLGGPFDDKATGVAVDSAGDVYVTGDFQGTMQIGTQQFTALGVSDAFVVKLDSSGNFLWSHQFQELSGIGKGGVVLGDLGDGGLFITYNPVSRVSPYGDTASGIAVDAAGNVYVTGLYQQEVDFGGPILGVGNTESAYVAKLTSDGVCLWAEPVESGGAARESAVAVDGSGNVYAVASFRALDVSSALATSIDLQKMDSSGNILWQRPLVETTNAQATGLAVDQAGNVFVTGDFVGTGKPVNFDPTSGTADQLAPLRGTNNVFVEKLTSHGAVAWVQGMGNRISICTSTGIAVDNQGHVFVTGYFERSIALNGRLLQGAGLTNTFVAEFNGTGGIAVHSATEGGDESTRANAIAVGSQGFVIITGLFDGTTNLGGLSPLSVAESGDADSAGGTDIFVARLELAPARVPAALHELRRFGAEAAALIGRSRGTNDDVLPLAAAADGLPWRRFS
jgi:hypothetical protein